MIVLGVESTAIAASVALCDVSDDYQSSKVIANYTTNTALTHSETLMPMITNLLATAKMSMDNIEMLAVSAGPGSFTGVRIGVSVVKGMAFATNKPCVSVSSLKALALNLIGMNGIVCSVMDARRNQFYNAIFKIDGYKIERLTEDRAIDIEELKQELMSFDQPVYLVGDGAVLAKSFIADDYVKITSPALRLQSAASVCMGVIGEKSIDADLLMPVYLRLAQAERERKERDNDSNR